MVTHQLCLGHDFPGSGNLRAADLRWGGVREENTLRLDLGEGEPYP